MYSRAFSGEHPGRYSTDFDACRYWFLASQPCCGGRNRTGVLGLWAPRGTSPLPRYVFRLPQTQKVCTFAATFGLPTLLYPAMYLDYLKLKKFAHLPPRLDYQLSSTQICNYYTRLKKLCNLNYLKLAEDCLVAGDCSARERLCEFKRRASVCYLVAHLVRLPCFLQRT